MRRHLPSTQALACFEAAARHESYTRAAQELALTQSAVSRQIQALEEQLGVALFRRTRHGVVLTPAGQRYGRQAVNAACLLVSTVASFGTLALVIWSLHAAWDVLLPP